MNFIDPKLTALRLNGNPTPGRCWRNQPDGEGAHIYRLGWRTVSEKELMIFA